MTILLPDGTPSQPQVEVIKVQMGGRELQVPKDPRAVPRADDPAFAQNALNIIASLMVDFHAVVRHVMVLEERLAALEPDGDHQPPS